LGLSISKSLAVDLRFHFVSEENLSGNANATHELLMAGEPSSAFFGVPGVCSGMGRVVRRCATFDFLITVNTQQVIGVETEA
jgi:hypothetical protein